MAFRVLFLSLLLLAPAFAQETQDAPAPAAHPARVAATAEQLDVLFAECWNAADAEGMLSLYEPDAVLVGLDGTMVQGTEAIRTAIGSFGLGASKIETKVVNVARPAEDLAVLFNSWTIYTQNTDGTPLVIPGKAMEVVRRQADGTWRYAFDHPVAGDGIGWGAATPATPK